MVMLGIRQSLELLEMLGRQELYCSENCLCRITYPHTTRGEALYVVKLVDTEGEEIRRHADRLLKDVCFPLPSSETNVNTHLMDMNGQSKFGRYLFTALHCQSLPQSSGAPANGPKIRHTSY